MDNRRMIITKKHIKPQHICTVEGYIREVTLSVIYEDVIDLILFYYAKPMVINTKYKSQTKLLFISIFDSFTWFVLTQKIFEAYNLDKYSHKLAILTYENGIIHKYCNWKSCIWNEEHTFEIQTETATPILVKMDDALRRYYKWMGKEYENQFSEYCEENGFEDLDEEMGTGTCHRDFAYRDCMLTDFDENVPFKHQPKNKTKAIFDLLSIIYENTDCDVIDFENHFTTHDTILQITADDFKISKDELKQVRSIHCKQLKMFSETELKDDQTILKLLAIGEKHKKSYFLYLFDMFCRDRILANITDKNKYLTTLEWVKVNKHCIELRDKKVINIIQHGFFIFCRRVNYKLQLYNTIQILDDLEHSVRYISA
eukprot:448914_1